MFPPTDADRTCSPDLITLDSQVVVEYGKNVILNCSSPSDDYIDLFWKIGMMEGTDYMEIPVREFDMQTECFIKVNDSFECSKKLDIVVYSKSRQILAHCKWG